ncbi:MAG: hypothetical protein HC916_16610 [Coleofasciculaceae cyanobacterium SM2_1_6]|nr:hypothetical protein [Coleofasciculaceae cyanobacterium SM2_1_6]
MTNPRYEPEKDESRHGAVIPQDCLKMEKKYGWSLKRIEKTRQEILEYDCIFKGETEFPNSYYENDNED